MVAEDKHSNPRPAGPQVVAGAQPHYAENAERLGHRYGSLTFEEVHGRVVDLLPPVPAVAMDVG